jgi:hypothetical protein
MCFKTWTKSLFVIFVAALYGCSSTPTIKVEKGKEITITGSHLRHGSFAWQAFVIEKIDNKYIDYPFFPNKVEYEIPVLKGRRDLLVEATYIKSFSKGPKGTYLRITADLQPGTKYSVQGKVLDNGDIEAWVEEAGTGKHVSATVNSAAKSQPLPIPIFIQK